MSRIRKKLLPLLFAFTLCLSVLMVGFGKEVGGLLTANAGSTDYSIIRVNLKTMTGTTSIKITVNGTYSIQDITKEEYAFRNNVLLSKDKDYVFSVVNGEINITTNEGTFPLGKSVTLYSHTSDRNDYLTMQNKSYGTCNYLGNMKLSVESNAIKFVNELNIDDYLCGVVPYEMSEGQALESLKTQAVCARSYAYKIVAANPNASVHVMDTTDSQVYKGIKMTYTKCIMAVDQTAYQVLTYNGAYISTYYSSSNGGLTEDNHNAWGSTRLAYYVSKLDPYDTAYQNRTYTVSKVSPSASIASALESSAADLLDSSVYDVSTVKLLEIMAISPTYYNLPTSVELTKRRVASVAIGVSVSVKKLGGSTETKSLTIVKNYEKSRTIFNLPSTRYTVESSGSQFVFHCYGNGHGIGMSQNGTYARVKAGQTYDQVLAFYFSGTKIKTLKYQPYVYKEIPQSTRLDSQASLMEDAPAAMTGTVKATALIYENPCTLQESIGSIEENTNVTVLRMSTDWYKISFDDGNSTAYVYRDMIEITLDPETIDPEWILKVGVVNGTAKLRLAPTEDKNHERETLYEGDTVLVIHAKTSPYYYVYYNGMARYIACSSVLLTDIDVEPLYEATVTAYKAVAYEEPDVTSNKVTFFTKNSTVGAFETRNDDFVSIRYNGGLCYVSRDAMAINKEVIVGFMQNSASVAGKTEKRTVTATRDKVLYSDRTMTKTKAVLKKNDKAFVIAEDDDKLLLLYNGAVYYSNKDNLK